MSDNRHKITGVADGLVKPVVEITGFHSLGFNVVSTKSFADNIRRARTASKLLASSSVKAVVTQYSCKFSLCASAFVTAIDPFLSLTHGENSPNTIAREQPR